MPISDQEYESRVNRFKTTWAVHWTKKFENLSNDEKARWFGFVEKADPDILQEVMDGFALHSEWPPKLGQLSSLYKQFGRGTEKVQKPKFKGCINCVDGYRFNVVTPSAHGERIDTCGVKAGIGVWRFLEEPEPVPADPLRWPCTCDLGRYEAARYDIKEDRLLRGNQWSFQTYQEALQAAQHCRFLWEQEGKPQKDLWGLNLDGLKKA